jgi:hypothetical protein
MLDKEVKEGLADLVAGEFAGHAISEVLKMTGELYQLDLKVAD